MKVEVRLFATLAGYLPPGVPGDSVALDIPEGTTVGQVLRMLKVPQELDCMMVINGRDAAPEQALATGDMLSLFPPLAGGR